MQSPTEYPRFAGFLNQVFSRSGTKDIDCNSIVAKSNSLTSFITPSTTGIITSVAFASEVILEKFKEYGYDYTKVFDYKQFKLKFYTKTDHLPKATLKLLCRPLHNVMLAAIKSCPLASKCMKEISIQRAPIFASNINFEEQINDDIASIILSYDISTLLSMRFVNKRMYKLVKQQIVHLLNSETISFSDLKIYTMESFSKFQIYLGVEACKKITRLCLPIRLLEDISLTPFEETLIPYHPGAIIAKSFPNLCHLSFQSDKRKDFLYIDWGFVFNLPFLESIDLSGYPDIPKIEWLITITNLKKLNLNNCIKISDYVALDYLNKIEVLDISKGNFENLNFLESMKNLRDLNITGVSDCRDFSVLSQLTKLVRLKAADTFLNDINILKPLINLEELHIKPYIQILHNQYDIKSLTKLKHLCISYTDNTDFLEKMPNLEILRIEGSKKSTIDVPYLPKLKIMDIRHSKVSMIFFKKQMPNLQEFNAEGCYIDDIHFLKYVQNLEILNLNFNEKISDIKYFAYLKKLRTLALKGCLKISNPSDFQSLTSLHDLDLSDSDWIENLECLTQLSKLRSLNLKNCPNLNSIKGIKINFPQIEILNIDDCIKVPNFLIETLPANLRKPTNSSSSTPKLYLQ